MKKYILSTLVVLTFATYTLYQHIIARSLGSVSYALTPPVESPTPVQTYTPVQPPLSVQEPTPVAVKVTSTGMYKDGTYTGISADAYYGNIQVVAVVSGGKLTDVQFLNYPQDRSTSVRINTRAMPILTREAIQAQSSNVNTVSGATDSSGAFRQSLGSALAQAVNS